MDFLRIGLHTITNVNVAGGKRKSSSFFFFRPKRSLLRVPSLQKSHLVACSLNKTGEKEKKKHSSLRLRETQLSGLLFVEHVVVVSWCSSFMASGL